MCIHDPDGCDCLDVHEERSSLLAENARLREERDNLRSLTRALLHRLTLNGFTDCGEMLDARAALAGKE